MKSTKNIVHAREVALRAVVILASLGFVLVAQAGGQIPTGSGDCDLPDGHDGASGFRGSNCTFELGNPNEDQRPAGDPPAPIVFGHGVQLEGTESIALFKARLPDNNLLVGDWGFFRLELFNELVVCSETGSSSDYLQLSLTTSDALRISRPQHGDAWFPLNGEQDLDITISWYSNISDRGSYAVVNITSEPSSSSLGLNHFVQSYYLPPNLRPGCAEWGLFGQGAQANADAELTLRIEYTPPFEQDL